MTAYQWLQEHNWIQGQMFECVVDANSIVITTGGCLMGAIQVCYAPKCSYDADKFTEALKKVQKICTERFQTPSISEVNDDRISTKEEALEILKEAQV